MTRLELQAFANMLSQWGVNPTPTGMAGAGEIDVLITAETVDYVLVVAEPVVFVRDAPLVLA